MQEKQRYELLIAAVEAERENERQFFEKIAREKSKAEKEEAGVLLNHVSITRMYYTIGELVEIEIVKPLRWNGNMFKTGKGCSLQSEKHGFTYPGNISYENKKVIRVILKQEEILQHELLHDKSLSLEITYDDHPYKVKIDTLHAVIRSDSPLVQIIKKALNTGKIKQICVPDQAAHIHYSSLNPEQNEAISGAISAPRIAIIHGPPGTGKTTTTVSLVEAMKHPKKKILVCAPSNNATDLLALRLNQRGVKVLRIGNITRIGDDIAHLSIEEKMHEHPEWKRIKKVKVEAQEAHRQAQTYKRNFGQEEREHRKIMYQEARQLRQWARDLEERLKEDILADTEVVCTTLMSASLSILSGIKFDLTIVDEASQATEPECWIPILKANKLILVGDHKQLPPTVKSSKAIELGLDTTLLDLLTTIVQETYLLRCQYRMNDAILSFPNQEFYAGKLYGDPTVNHRYLKDDTDPVVIIDTSGCGFEEEFNYKNRSLKNPGEFFIIREHILSIRERLLGHSIGIISPYAEQVRHIRHQIAEDEEFLGMDIEVDTIDGFQGQEKEVIYLSLVRSNINGEIGFLKDERRLNVALTRAMKKIVIIGDTSTIGREPLYLNLIEHIEKAHKYQSAWEYMSY